MSGRIVYTPERAHHRQKSGYGFKKMAIFAAVIFVIAGLIYGFRHPDWQLKNINVTGTRAISDKEIRSLIFGEISGNYAFLVPRASIFLLREKNLIAKLREEFPRVEKVSLTRRLPDGLEVDIVERKLWAILCNDNFTPENREDTQCVFMDSEGRALDQAPDSSGSLVVKIKTDFPALPLGENLLASDFVEYLKEFGDKIEEGIGSAVVVYELSSVLSGEFKLVLNDDFTLLVNKNADATAVLKVLKTVLEEEIEDKRKDLDYVDLRFGNKVFYRFKN